MHIKQPWGIDSEDRIWIAEITYWIIIFFGSMQHFHLWVSSQKIGRRRQELSLWAQERYNVVLVTRWEDYINLPNLKHIWKHVWYLSPIWNMCTNTQTGGWTDRYNEFMMYFSFACSHGKHNSSCMTLDEFYSYFFLASLAIVMCTRGVSKSFHIRILAIFTLT